MLPSNKGFTLIEVLVALSIIAIALSAIIKATSQNIQHTIYMQNKTVANWVGTEIIARIQTGILILPKAPDSITLETTMLNQKWFSKANLNNTPNPRIKKIEVTVSQHENPFIHLEGYLYAE